MYSNNFVVSILKNGRPVKEFDGKVYLPFNTEYSIRLKNKHNRRAVANVFIDKNEATALGGIIINPRQDVTLERFLNYSLSKGPKFKFVSLDHPGVDDPTNRENGIVRVDFRLEQKLNLYIPTPIKPDFPIKPLKYKKGRDVDWKYNPNSTTADDSTFPYTFTYCMSTPQKLTKGCGALPGATVGGDQSNQSFKWGDSFETETMATVIEIRIFSSADQNEPRNISNYSPKYCTRCGRRRRAGDIYCSSCGRKY